MKPLLTLLLLLPTSVWADPMKLVSYEEVPDCNNPIEKECGPSGCKYHQEPCYKELKEHVDTLKNISYHHDREIEALVLTLDEQKQKEFVENLKRVH